MYFCCQLFREFKKLLEPDSAGTEESPAAATQQPATTTEPSAEAAETAPEQQTGKSAVILSGPGFKSHRSCVLIAVFLFQKFPNKIKICYFDQNIYKFIGHWNVIYRFSHKESGFGSVPRKLEFSDVLPKLW